MLRSVLKRLILEALRDAPDAFYRLLAGRIQPYLTRPAALPIHTALPLRCKVGETYTLFTREGPLFWWASFDFSASRAGDRFRIEIYHLIRGGWKLHNAFTMDGQLDEPICTLNDRFAPGLKICLSQTRGLSKEIYFELWGREPV